MTTGAEAPRFGRRATVTVKQFFVEGEIEGTPGIVRWFVLQPADGTLRWFDENCVQEMLLSNMATEMFSRLAVKEAAAPLPSMPAEPPAYRATLEGGTVVAGYLVRRSAPR
jgi:hypothetical protein